MLLQAGVQREREAALELLPAPGASAIRPAVPTLLSACTSDLGLAQPLGELDRALAPVHRARRSLASIRSCAMLL